MTGPKRFEIYVANGVALPVAVYLNRGRGNTQLAINILCFGLALSWGPGFRVGPNPADS